jgi:hypothetical protein
MKLRYSLFMATLGKAVRKSVALPLRTAKRVSALANSPHTSANRELVDLIEPGLQSREAEKQHYLGMVEKLATTTDATVRQQLKQKLAELTFGA